jgi:Fe-S-cluster containining protein
VSLLEGSICIGCGLCCDGTLHGRATVRSDDEATVTAAGLEIGEEDGKRFFRQPCPHFSCGSCLIYDRRPAVCRTYRCALLKNLEAGNIGRAKAVEKIAEAKRHIDAVRRVEESAVTPADRTALVNRLKASLAEADDESRQSVAKALLDIGVLDHFLNRWFLRKDED